ncbi:MAG: phosphoribosylformylglycinamidine synthase subunit PurQ [Schleiferiaceae bacterium]|nr:phosphoribosylformylglycinamidine synthase subunit PurQ [Schleiferiaceae bacterium]
MKFGVVTFPGSNCDQDMIDILRDGLGCETVPLWHKDHDIKGVDMIVLPGGFSYGDYLRSGAIASFSPIMEEVTNHAARGGYVLGICNGFQILTETQLLNGGLLHNISHKFICKNVLLSPSNVVTPITAELDKEKTYKIPIAHGEGRFYADEEIVKSLNDNSQIMFRYVDYLGNPTKESNPNGSIENIAGISNKNGNVMGMMPHPERAADENLLNTDGLALFQSVLNSAIKT